MDWLAERFPPSRFPAILEPGVGTGRIALPLVERGYQVIGLDISEGMLSACTAQSQALGAGDMLHCLRADAASLPLRSMSFDLCVAVHLFYFISDWRGAAREMLRVLEPFGTLILLHTGFGTEVPHLNERYREIAGESGYTFPAYGVRSTREVVDYAASLGCAAERVDRPEWEWTTKIKVREAVEHLRNRAYSFTKDVPDTVHLAVMARLQQESFKASEATSAEIEVPNRISIILIRQPRRRIIAP